MIGIFFHDHARSDNYQCRIGVAFLFDRKRAIAFFSPIIEVVYEDVMEAGRHCQSSSRWR